VYHEDVDLVKKPIMSIVCPQCNTPITADAIQNKQAQCPNCHYEFNIARLLKEEEARKKADIKIPHRIKKYIEGDTLVLTRPWKRSLAVYVLIAMVLMLIYIILKYPTMDVSFYVMCSVIVYTVFAPLWFLNTTYIRVNTTTLTINERPFPVFMKTVNSDEVKQLYVKEDRDRIAPYSVMVIVANNSYQTYQTLIGYLPTAEEAWYIEQEIEKHLGIEDVPIAGEYRA